MSSLFNPETVSSLLCCYRYTALLRVQVLPSGAPFSLSCLWIVKKNKSSVSSFLWEVVLFSVEVRLSSPDVPCFCSHLVFVSFSLSLSFSLLRDSELQLSFSTQVVNKGGIQFQERSLIGWFGKFGWFSYPLSLSPSSFSLWDFLSSYFPPVTTNCVAIEKIMSFLCPLSPTCFLFL